MGDHLVTRRRLAAAAAAAGATALARPAIAQGAPLRIGVMLPYSGTFAALGENITAAFEMHLAERGNRLGGRAVQIIRLDDESNPATAVQNVLRLVQRDRAEVLVGTVHSGVAMAMVQVARDRGVPLFIPNAGVGAATGQLCAPNIFRSSFTNWQPSYAAGFWLGRQGVRRAAWMTWDYAAGAEAGQGFREGLEAAGGQVVRELKLPFPETNFQPLLAQIPGLGVEAVGAFFAGGGAIQFVREYAAAGLKDRFPLTGSGFLTEGTLAGQGAAAEGMKTTLHYGDRLDTPRNTAFRAAFRARTGREADVYAVQGYDAAQMLAIGMEAVRGDLSAEREWVRAIRTARIDSPRGPMTLSPSHNPVQPMYLREARGGENVVIGTVIEALADPGTGCRMSA
ncbi:MAG: ABC transporter substrate-binding protein [Acetobacteraceae bacterium]|nr:ABC transporter substrate-binding protein [Acetobacteraceae bacterium]MDW8399568.1 ABC transporter substrate-binding protein [Acetobacteraceae bacterium]